MSFKSVLKTTLLFTLLMAMRFQLTLSTNETNPEVPKTNLVAGVATTQVSLTVQSMGNNQYKLSPDQCMHIDRVFEASKLTMAQYVDSCESRFIQVHRLYDDSLLMYISMKDWATENNKSIINLGKLTKQISLDYRNAQLVVRLDSCLVSLPQIEIRVSPPPRLTVSGLVKVNISGGVGEHLMWNSHSWQDQLEVYLEQANTKCTLVNSYLLVCARNRAVGCKVRLFDEQQQLVECHCDDTSVTNYVLAFVVAILLILLIIINLINCSKYEEETGINEEYVSGNITSRENSYYYQVIYRVACPTTDFDCQNSIMGFEVLCGSKFEPAFNKVTFSMTNMSGIKWNVFTTNVYLVAPLPKLKAVRVSHERGINKTGLFLFDVLVNFIRGPELDFDVEKSEHTQKPIAVDESTIRNQRLKIYAYILDHPKVYLKVKKGAKVEMPPMSYPEVDIAFLKVLAWLANTETILSAVILLDHLYLLVEMTILATGIALFLTFALSLELVIIVAVHSYLAIKSLEFELFYDYLASSSGKSKKSRPSNWHLRLSSVFMMILLLLIGGCLVAIALRFEQPLFKTLYVEAIIILVFVLVGGGSWLLYETIDQWPALKRERITTEKRLIVESDLRGSLFSATNSESNAKGTDSSTGSITKETANPSRLVAPNLTKGTFEMFSSSK